MILTATSNKSVAELRDALPRAAATHKYGVLGILDLSAKMKEKGVDFEGEVLIFEVCNPQQAKAVLEMSSEMSSFLPCRISVYRASDGTTKLSTLRPTALVQGFGATSLGDVAAEVEAALTAIIDEAR
ncbi:MAG: DUF302 domain-containing protein [Myxococcota bacterium]|jgi:uncharacterized protein (DUF302 family)|nr:DUF302 domain-containing protein [Myxococcota bacterium]